MKKLIFSILSLTIFANPLFAYAEEISVSGNSAESSSNVNISVDQSSSANQSNEANISNNIEANSNTGNNEASQNNGGEVNIQTGDSEVSSTIINHGINQNYAETGCCPGDTSIKVNGNGAESNNNIDYSRNYTTNINSSNTANIINNVNGYANTGYNKANQNNGGSVSITTGDIKVTDIIRNKSINISAVEASAGTGESLYIAVNDNAYDSDNSIKVNDESSINVNVDNEANIENNSEWYVNTGGNEANQNNKGDVNITTGDVVVHTTIENKDININIVDVDCCEEDKGKPIDTTPPPPAGPSQGGHGGGGNGGGQGGPSAGPTSQVLGAMLPATGNYSMVLFLIGNIAMLFLGGYLRLRSGRSPNYLFAR
jgi:hypothetical protein